MRRRRSGNPYGAPDPTATVFRFPYTVSVDHAIVVAAPPEGVWEFVTDLERYPEWSVGDSVEILGDATEFGEGTRYREVGRIGPREIITEFEFVEWDPHVARFTESKRSATRRRSSSKSLPSVSTLTPSQLNRN